MPPYGGHPDGLQRLPLSRWVSSRAPVWGASPAAGSFFPGHQRFKSCPRMGGIVEAMIQKLETVVSSRAPVWGASEVSGLVIQNIQKVSSRAPVWGASYLLLPVHALYGGVSSRAPVWGASCKSGLPGWQQMSFKSCPRMGGISSFSRCTSPYKVFQVVPPYGGHPIALKHSAAPPWFQVVPPYGGHPLRR